MRFAVFHRVVDDDVARRRPRRGKNDGEDDEDDDACVGGGERNARNSRGWVDATLGGDEVWRVERGGR